ncbi:uncharacterized protein NMK_0069 [Novimethylophilus kurashikiensis]|uniref:Lysozyme inhibitor LprI-like N-terminal domain-containing protein n=1 Tax=Novimethylophilus kurashikiensis TaxID=1825523 RepID=A0A2R5F439_9PROT|nr:lysozyme inhibitor LprI family protein [Novimethylophilus kurashikiensis]GBG12538.1 uncharacterized protein NMK_0069 [Novimethylophilus kurashikiensis]
MKVFATLFFLIFTLPVFAAENFCDSGKPHPIDLWAEKANEKTGGISVNVRKVQSEEYSRWDKELNQTYSSLFAKLNDADKNRLKEAQRAWLKYRDAEIEWYWSKAMFGDEGTSAPIIVAGIGIDMLRKRVCDLMQYKKRADDAY